MKKLGTLSFMAILSLFIFTACAPKQNNQINTENLAQDTSMTGETTIQEEQTNTGGETLETTTQEEKTNTGSTTETKILSYQDYSIDGVNQALTANKKVVLFFHANRCPSCRSLEKEINNGLSTIPGDTVIFKVDYDNASDMKKQYSITSQHTLVSIDKSMNMISKKTGGDLNDILAMQK